MKRRTSGSVGGFSQYNTSSIFISLIATSVYSLRVCALEALYK